MSETLKFGNGLWATKEGSTLAYNSENGNFKPLPFNFTRDTIATRVNKEGLIEVVSNNEPRIDFTDNSKGALLLEPTRTNLFPYSEDFSQWTAVRANINLTPNSIISPNGSLNATKVSCADNTFSDYCVFNTLTSSSKSFSLYAKKGELNYLYLGNNNSNSSEGVFFDLENGTINKNESAFDASIINVGNGWYRCIVYFTTISTHFICMSEDGESFNLQNNQNNGIYIWGAQVEKGSYATSYIPTSGSIATRDAESASQTPLSGVIGQTELTVFYQGIVERLGGDDGHAISLSQSVDSSGSSRILLYRDSSSGSMYVYVQDSTTQFTTPLLANSNPQVNDKYAIAIKDNDLVVYCNGVKVSENNLGTIPSTQYVYLNKWNNQINEQNKIKEVKLYNTRLSNSELAALTS